MNKKLKYLLVNLIFVVSITILLTIITSNNNTSGKVDKKAENTPNNSANTESTENNKSENSDTQPQNTKREVSDILALEDNTTPYNELIKTLYTQDELELLVYDSNQLTIDEVDQKFRIECLRKVSDTRYYAIYQTQEGGVLVVLFVNEGREFIPEEGRLLEYGEWYIRKPATKAQFEELRVGKDTWDNVHEIDKYSHGIPLTGVEAPTVTYHRTVDGYSVYIKYEIEESIITEFFDIFGLGDSGYRITDIKIEECHQDTVYANLIPIDLEILEEMY